MTAASPQVPSAPPRRTWILALDERSLDLDALARSTAQAGHEVEVLTVRRDGRPVQERRGALLVTRLELRGATEHVRQSIAARRVSFSDRWRWLEHDAPVVRVQLAARRVRAAADQLSSLGRARSAWIRVAGEGRRPSAPSLALAYAVAVHRLAGTGVAHEVHTADRGAAPAAAVARLAGRSATPRISLRPRT